MGIFGISRGRVKELRRQETLETLKRKKKEKELKEKTEKAKAEASYYKAQAERKKAKASASKRWPALPTPRVKIRKKRQGKPLSRKKRIGLI